MSKWMEVLVEVVDSRVLKHIIKIKKYRKICILCKEIVFEARTRVVEIWILSAQQRLCND